MSENAELKTAIVLLVEDSEMDIELTQLAFEEVSVKNTIKVCSTGESALNYLNGVGKYADRMIYPLPDFILLDIHLPSVNGHQVLEK